VRELLTRRRVRHTRYMPSMPQSFGNLPECHHFHWKDQSQQTQNNVRAECCCFLLPMRRAPYDSPYSYPSGFLALLMLSAVPFLADKGRSRRNRTRKLKVSKIKTCSSRFFLLPMWRTSYRSVFILNLGVKRRKRRNRSRKLKVSENNTCTSGMLFSLFLTDCDAVYCPVFHSSWVCRHKELSRKL
jgi:hypothetical protein